MDESLPDDKNTPGDLCERYKSAGHMEKCDSHLLRLSFFLSLFLSMACFLLSRFLTLFFAIMQNVPDASNEILRSYRLVELLLSSAANIKRETNIKNDLTRVNYKFFSLP